MTEPARIADTVGVTADEIVRALAAMDPIGEADTADLYCIFCDQAGAVTRTDIAGNEVRRGPVTHADSCIWAAACELIDGDGCADG